ncbi:glucose PTS transporter subunit IIA [Pediococcus cellicola]|uniref:Beta-glucoside-specific phosphotransferase system (PTS), IIABC component n=1 Tax=Pediococcus cellicola TaxID=319652 RepID=A0A0R2ITU1_9LACO|nr:glucose PTS transporter subunit IIA [Pediococcus cellicola]KRN66950.1 Beta-glucoside-specific phosphotransferase system (PTS), IIABC component [Pediococcus cellicola]GEL15117.1 PTS beta-glucoside transporter subunit EIIBCA [Pediococcus cellicola]
MDYHKLAQQIVENVGNVENIKSVTHCMTRLRFVLKDVSKANKTDLEDMDAVLGVVYAGGQYMIILGQNLLPTYNAIVKDFDLTTEKPIDENLDVPKETKWTWRNAGGKIINFIQASVTPMIPGLIAGGMFKVVLLLIITFIEPSFAKTTTYTLLSAIADSPFYFMPIVVAYGAATKLGGTPTYSMMATASLLYPGFHDLVTQMAAHPNMANPTLFNLPVKVINYGTSLLPALLISIVAYFTEKFLNKIVPGIFKSIFVGLGTIFVSGTLGFLILGPIGDYLGQMIATLVMFLNGTVGPLAVGLLAAVLPWLVMTGMHTALAPFMPQLISDPGYDPILRPAFLLHNMSEGGANIGVALKTKNKKLKSQAWSLAVGAIVAGVTEPSLYGINLKYKKPMYGVMAGGFAGGVVAGIFGAKAYIMGYSNVLALPIFEKTVGAIVGGIITAIVVSAAVTFVLGIDEGKKAKSVTTPVSQTYPDNAIVAVSDGIVEPLKEVKDEAFASGALGKGVAFKLESNFICSPANGEITAMFPTGHAFGITTKEGIEILVHIGINTVNLKGEGFDVLVHQGDKVRAGEPIVRVDRKLIEGKGYDLTTMLILTNPNGKKVLLKEEGQVSVGTILNEGDYNND